MLLPGILLFLFRMICERQSLRIETVRQVLTKVWSLFKDHKELILGFNAFLPNGIELNVDKPPVDFRDAIAFVNKIKRRFQDGNKSRYKSFLDAVNTYRTGFKPIRQLQKEVANISVTTMILLRSSLTFFATLHLQSLIIKR